MKTGVLIIGSTDAIYHEIYKNLQSATTEVFCAHSFEDTLAYYRKEQYVLVILDAAISKADDYRLLHVLRHERPIPIFVLSSLETTGDRLKAFQAGANVYMGKPYSLEECLEQAKSLIRLYEDISQQHLDQTEMCFQGGLSIRPAHRQVYSNSTPINLTRKEFDILFCLASHPGQVFSREQLYSYVWDTDTSFNIDEVVKAHIKTLRKKLSISGQEHIENVWGVGYRFTAKRTVNCW